MPSLSPTLITFTGSNPSSSACRASSTAFSSSAATMAAAAASISSCSFTRYTSIRFCHCAVMPWAPVLNPEDDICDQHDTQTRNESDVRQDACLCRTEFRSTFRQQIEPHVIRELATIHYVMAIDEDGQDKQGRNESCDERPAAPDVCPCP